MRPWNLSHFVLIALAAQSAFACRKNTTAGDTFSTQGNGAAPRADRAAGDQIMTAADISRLQQALPRFAWSGIDEILKSPRTMWYNHKTITPSYQDSVGDGTSAPIGARPNSRAEGIIVPEGRHLFTGEKWSFPFGTTAGTDKSDNVEIGNFLHLPEESGRKLPLVYWVEINQRNLGIEDTKWKWMYPKGTVLGELIFLRSPDGGLYLTELRTRTRYLDGWAINVYRPFDTAQALARAIKSRRASWASNSSLAAAVASLEGQGNLTALSLRSTAFPGVFEQNGALDDLPDLGDPELVKDLLRNTAFVSAYGTTWKESGGMKSFAPTTSSNFSIVPRSYQAGILEVTDKSCARCHQETGRAINDFVSQAVLYGDIWGEDGIFSFHPYDENQYPEFNTDNRQVRPEFTSFGVVEKYDPSRHNSARYKKIFKN